MVIETELDKNSEKGLNGQAVAEKFMSGNLPNPVDENSYNGYGHGSSSLQNVTEKSKRSSIEPNKEEDI